MRDRIFIPTDGPESWRRFLADPEKHWKPGYSAWAIAHSWERGSKTTPGLPVEVAAVLEQVFGTVELILAIPEHKVSLPGGATASQNDVWALVRCERGLISIAVEGKVDESFDVIVREWRADASRGKENRFEYLTSLLDVDGSDLDPIRYQFLHRSASAIIEAQRFGARDAVMLVHSYSDQQSGFEDFAAFAKLFSLEARPGELLSAPKMKDPRLHLAWVQGR